MISTSRLTIFIVIIMAGCNKDKLKLADLKWGDNYRERIAINHVDTAYLISKNKLLNLGGSDTIGVIAFDAFGNTIYDRRTQFFGNTSYYRYDSNHLVIYKNYVTDFEDKNDITYRFFPDSLVVYQYWTHHDPPDPHLIPDLWVHRFDKNGLLIASEKEDGPKLFYKYNSKGLLATEYYDSLNSPTNSSVKQYYYSTDKLDSTVLTYYDSYLKRKVKWITYFDKSGLITKTIWRDSIITTFRYTKRKL